MLRERHPLQPFLPPCARILFLGSFPPPRAKWSMDFFYPNFINDFWRVMGILHYGDRDHFVAKGERRFDRDAIVAFSQSRGLAFFDTATEVVRLKDNASDAFLEVVQPTDIVGLLSRIPTCRSVVTTGGKASEQLAQSLCLTSVPAVGASVEVVVGERRLTWWRMPSTSRAYPLSLDRKASAYARLFAADGVSDSNSTE